MEGHTSESTWAAKIGHGKYFEKKEEIKLCGYGREWMNMIRMHL